MDMQIQVNTDHNFEGHGELVRYIEAEVGTALSRFDEHITRVEVHLSDENAGKSGGVDKRCMLEARPAGQQPVAVTHHAATLDEACSGAIQKLKHLLDSEFGKLEDRKGTASIRGNKRH
jgi:hypothetical protein